MRIIEIKAYTFDELSDAAKQKAREWWKKDLDYLWFEDALASVKAFCDEFGVIVKDYEFAGYGPSFIHTDADNQHFRGYTLQKAKDLQGKFDGYYLNYTLTDAFVEAFQNSGDAKHAFDCAIRAAVKTIEADIEYQYTDECVDECLIANGYEFDEEGNRV